MNEFTMEETKSGEKTGPEQEVPSGLTREQLAAEREFLEKKILDLREQDRFQLEFLNILAHDLRTPLTSIKSYADLLIRYRDEEEEIRFEFLQTIASEADRMHRLINDFLDLTKMEQGCFLYREEVVDLVALGRYYRKVFESEFSRRKIQLHQEIEDPLPPVLGDGGRIGQVMTNLISNALKFTPEEGQIKISMKRVPHSHRPQEGADFNQNFPFQSGEGDHEWIAVSIEDSGPGIPVSDRTKVFDKYYQVSRKDRCAAMGTGLGLPISQQIVRQHGGVIYIEDGTLGGTCFVFTLPCSRPASET